MATLAPHSHCSFCGTRFPSGVGWPRTCAGCGNVSYRNPLPVAVVVLPVEHAAVLMVRRATPPFGLALPSGFVEYGERWQDAAAREVQEETGVRIDPEEITSFRVTSGNDGMLLVYATAPPVGRDALDAFEPSDEVSELLVVDRPDADVVFPRDGEVLAAWFDGEPSHSASRWRSSASSRSDDRRR